MGYSQGTKKYPGKTGNFSYEKEQGPQGPEITWPMHKSCGKEERIPKGKETRNTKRGIGKT